MPPMKTLSLCAALAAFTLSLSAQKMATPAGEAPGPWILGTIGVGKTADPKVPQTTALKGIAIKVGENGEAAVAYDLDLCRMVGAWTGKFTTPMNLMSRGEYPTAMGEVAFTTGEVPGFLLSTFESRVLNKPAGVLNKDAGVPRKLPGVPDKSAGVLNKQDGALDKSAGGQNIPAGVLENQSGAQKNTAGVLGKDSGAVQNPAGAVETVSGPAWKDPRPEPFGPLPEGQARFRGFYVNGGKTILKWDIGGVEVLERPDYLGAPDLDRFTRAFSVGPSKASIFVPLCRAEAPAGKSIGTFPAPGERSPVREIDGTYYLELPPRNERWSTQVEVLVSSSAERIKRTVSSLSMSYMMPDPTGFLGRNHTHWKETVTTTGEVSEKKDEAYVVDTIKLPDPNPWGAPMFVGGFDFFPDGRAAVCTFHGDVFLVSGIDAELKTVTWKRFASGLYHALGLKIVNGEIYVTCRDGLWRLKDLNGDGECDFYEAFNFDLKVTKNFHEFVFDLQMDPAGNFYFAKGGPVKNGGRGFDQIMAHHGSLLRVSPDGAKLDVVATGFRAPNGIGVGPRGELTSGDNEGTWTPACKINWIKPGGFNGVVDLAHRPTPPTDYDRPLCWLPKRVDNSGGGQVWVPPGDKWGPWGGQMLHLSYGTCSVFGVIKETVRPPANVTVPPGVAPPEIPALPPIVQGGVVRFPVNFQSGIMRARFNPNDGQLYVGGLRGWQTTGVKNGAFQRVRYTGAPVRMPLELHATPKGVRLTFTCKLDPATANDPQNWNVEVWNYLWSAAYGSPEFSTIEPVEKPADAGKQGEAQFSKTQIAQKKHDSLTVKNATLSADGRSVFLEIPEIKPVMQMAIKFGLKAADGAELRSEVINTIHALSAE